MEKKKCMIPASVLAYLDQIPKVLEPERKKPYTLPELKEVQKLLKDFGVEKSLYQIVPENVLTSGQLNRWKNDLISERLNNYSEGA